MLSAFRNTAITAAALAVSAGLAPLPAQATYIVTVLEVAPTSLRPEAERST
jgi:hypothetical protein